MVAAFVLLDPHLAVVAPPESCIIFYELEKLSVVVSHSPLLSELVSVLANASASAVEASSAWMLGSDLIDLARKERIEVIKWLAWLIARIVRSGSRSALHEVW
jgi:hypothetical protein